MHCFVLIGKKLIIHYVLSYNISMLYDSPLGIQLSIEISQLTSVLGELIMFANSDGERCICTIQRVKPTTLRKH